MLEALREGSVYVRDVPGGGKATVIVGDKVSEGDKTLVPLFTAYGREPILAPDGKPMLVELSRCRRCRLAAACGWRCVRSSTRSPVRTTCVDPDPATRRGAATKMGNSGARKRRCPSSKARSTKERGSMGPPRHRGGDGADPVAHRDAKPSVRPRPSGSARFGARTGSSG